MAHSTLLLLHHNAFAAVGEGNKGGSGGRESTLIFLGEAQEKGIYSTKTIVTLTS
jgi:hypothetical protein